MAEQHIPVVDGVVIMGISVSRAQEPLLRRVMRLSVACLACFGVYFAGSCIQYTAEGVSGQQWVSLVIFLLLCGVGVPVSGYVGAKSKNPGMLQAFSVGEGCLACSSFFTVVSTFSGLYWLVNNYCETEDCRQQFVNGSTCVTISDRQARGRRQPTRVEVSKELCENPMSDWYVWFVLVFCGVMGSLACAATLKSWELRNQIMGGLYSPRVGHRSRQSPVATQAVIVQGGGRDSSSGQNPPAAPPIPDGDTYERGTVMSVQMVPMARKSMGAGDGPVPMVTVEPKVVVADQGESKLM